jgi:hypothetical protein
MAATGERAGFPTVSKCIACHREVKKLSPLIRRLAALPGDSKPFPAVRVHKLADFVFFSHARHLVAKIACQNCHGAVMQGVQEAPTTMKACADCHKANRASMVCNACHELNQ